MFCNNCGSKLPDGSRFCSVCGNRLVDLEPSVAETKPIGQFGYAEEVRTDADRSESYDNAAARVSFDWSNVIEEPVKKVVPEIRSPWDEPVVEERPAVEKPALDHRRTMSFIEILKQEREEKLRAAELEAQAVTSKPEVEPDYSEFENAPQMYSDIAKSVEAPLYDEPVIEEPANEEPKFGFETADLTDYEPPLHTLAETAAIAEPLFETPDLFKDIKEPSIAAAPVEEEPAPYSFGSSLNVEDFYNQTLDFGEAEPSNLEAELDAILNASAGRVSRAERNAAEEIEEQAPAQEEIIADEAEMEHHAVEPELYSEPEFEAPLVEEPVIDDSLFAAAEEIEINPFAETEEIEEEEAVEEVPEVTFDESMFAPANTVDEPFNVPEFEPPLVEESIFEEIEPKIELEPEAEPELEFESSIEPVVEPEPVVEFEPVVEPELEVEPEAAAPTIEEIVAADAAEPHDTSRSTIAPPADEESEIEELKKRLAMLMNDEPVKPVEAVAEETPATEENEEVTVAEEATDAISLDDLEKDLFGDVVPEDIEAEATKKIDKFYTLYKKNEEFQRLLEEEYDKLKEADEAQVAEEVPVEKEEAPATPGAIDLPKVEAVEQAEDKKNAKAEAKQAKKEAKKAKKSEKAVAATEEASKGSGVLTVLAVIIAVILVVLLGVILILNFAPDSGIAMTIDSIIENVASYFTDAGAAEMISLL